MTRSVSLIVDAAITRPEALEQVARAAGSEVSGAGTPDAHVLLAGGAVASVDVPKFGEAPPLVIDIRAEDVERAREAAGALRARLAAMTDWPITEIR